MRIAQAAGHAYSEVWSRWGLGRDHLRRGDFAAAIRVLEPGVALGRAAQIRVALMFVAAGLGSAYLWAGRRAEAMPLLEEAVEASTAIGNLADRASLIGYLAEGNLAVGRFAEARGQAEQALAWARGHGQRSLEAWGLRLLGDIYAQDSAAAEQAGDTYVQALALATELGMRPFVAHCHLGLGTLKTGIGETEEAREHLATATALYREMDMPFWLEQAELKIKAMS